MRQLACALMLVCPLWAWAQPSAGPELWRRRCAMCHGEDGRGRTKVADRAPMPDFASAAWQQQRSDDQIRASIRLGGKDPMPAFKDRLSAQDLDALVRFIRGLAGAPGS